MFAPRLRRFLIWLCLAFCLAIAPSIILTTPAFSESGNQFYQSINRMESDWQQEYENYFRSDLNFASMDINVMSASLDEMATQTGERTALLWIMGKGNQISMALLTPGKMPIHRTTLVDQDTMIATKMAFFQGLTRQHPLFRNNYLQPAQTLYDWLIRPMAATLEIEHIDNLLFCTGEGLRTIPFGALHDGEKFLVERYGVGIIPAFQLMEQGYHKVGDRPVLAMGASSFEELPDLPGVAVELATITPTLRKGKSFLNQAFTLDALRQERNERDYGIVHLATHAEFQSGTPENSYIQFSDQRLTLDQIQTLNWQTPPVDLLVLSACRTALGDADAELGFAGLAIQSGVRSAIASLWYASDVGSVVLMNEFYKSLSQNTTKITALREAQLAMIHQEITLPDQTVAQLTPENFGRSPDTSDFSHPYYWAAYNLIGNPW